MTDTTTAEETTTDTAENTSQAEVTQGSLGQAVPTDGTAETSSATEESQADDSTTTTTEEKPAGEADATAEAEGKTEESKADESTSDDEKPEGAPETYEEFATPEGVAPIGKVTDEAFRSVMKESNLTQDQAQNVLSKLGPALKQDVVDRTNAQIQSWVKDCQLDPDIGGDKLPESVAAAEAAFSAAASPELQQLVRESGIGNHPDFIKSWKWVKDRMSDDNFVAGDPPKSAPKLTGNTMRNAKTVAGIFYKD